MQRLAHLASLALFVVALAAGASADTGAKRVSIGVAIHTTSRVLFAGTSSDGRDVLATCGGRPMLDAVGAGSATPLGTLRDAQSHCLNTDGTFDNGQFKFIGAALVSGVPGGLDSGDCDPSLPGPDGDCIIGRYRGHLQPTFNSVFPGPMQPAPDGIWLVYGEICYAGGTGRFANVVDDCAAGRFQPARGISNLSPDPSLGYAEIYLDGTLRLALTR